MLRNSPVRSQSQSNEMRLALVRELAGPVGEERIFVAADDDDVAVQRGLVAVRRGAAPPGRCCRRGSLTSRSAWQSRQFDVWRAWKSRRNCFEAAVLDGVAHGGGQGLEEGDVVPAQQHLAEDFVGPDQVVQIGLRIGRGRAFDGRVQRVLILGEAGVLEVDRAVPGPGLAVAAGPGGQDAVEHVDAAIDRLDQVDRLAHAHQIAGAVGGQHVGGVVEDLAHGLCGPRRRPGRRWRSRRSRSPAAVPRTGGAGPRRSSPAGCRTGPGSRACRRRPSSGRPSGWRAPSRPCARGLLGRIGDALVELHRDVGADAVGLDLDRAFGRQDVFGAVDVAGEGDGLFLDLGDAGQGHDLEAAAVGQDRLVPAHEFVEAAQPLHPLGAGAQHQVVGVAQDDVGAGRLDLIDRHRLDRGGGADRHEGGGADVAARGLQDAGAGAAFGGGNVEREGQRAGLGQGRRVLERGRGVGKAAGQSARTSHQGGVGEFV